MKRILKISRRVSNQKVLRRIKEEREVMLCIKQKKLVLWAYNAWRKLQTGAAQYRGERSTKNIVAAKSPRMV